MIYLFKVIIHFFRRMCIFRIPAHPNKKHGGENVISIAVAEGNSRALYDALSDALHRRGASAELVSCCAGDSIRCDLLLCLRADLLPAQAKVQALVAAEDAAAAAALSCQAETVVTCGLDSRCTLTPSALLDGGGMATLQREIPTLCGGVCLPQEIPLDDLPGPPEQRLLLAGALLLME